MIFSYWIFRVFFLSLLISAAPALAELKGYVSGVAGLSVPNYEDTSERLNYSFMGGFRLDSEIGVGAYYMTSSKKEDMNGADVSFDFSLFGAQGTFQFEGEDGIAFCGLRVGIAKLKIGDFNSSPFHYGVFFGYEKFLVEYFSLGAEVSWMSVSSSKDNGVKKESFQTFNFNGTAKFWF